MAVATAVPWTAAAAPPPAPAPAPAPAQAPAVPALAVDAPAPAASSAAVAPMFGVRWRVPVPGAGNAVQVSPPPIMRPGEAMILAGATLTVLDPANGKRKRGGRLAYKLVIGGEGGLVVTSSTEEIGIDPTKLTPTWRAPVPHSLVMLGEWVVETPKHSLRKQVARLRRARDGQIMWELDDELNMSATAQRFVDGPTLYLQLAKSVAAIETATGKLRWRRAGTLQSASEGRVAISAAPGQVVIVDGDGRDQWSARCQSIVLRGKTAYVTTGKDLAAIDLATNHVLWRRADLRAFASDASWVYTRSGSEDAELKLVVLAADTGAIAGQLPQTRTAALALVGDGSALLVDGKWAFGLGGLSKPTPVRELAANVCMIVHGCRTNTAPLIGGKVVLDGFAATTDRRGCFRWKGKTGLAPLPLAVSGGEVVGQPAVLDVPFPDAVVIDSAAATVFAEFQGSGCDDHTHTGGFP